MRQRIAEAGKILASKAGDPIRVRLIRQGSGSTADYPAEFFTQENADALAGALSFPSHPSDLDKPHERDPLSAIGSIGEKVTISEDASDGMLEMWGEFIPPRSKPQIAEYLHEFGHKLGISIYADSDGHRDSGSGKWIAEALDPSDPYKSVDLVIAAGAGGKFEKIAESLGLLPKASATAEEKEVTHMDKDIEARFEGLTKLVENLVKTIDGSAKADLQVVADTDAAEKLAEARIENYDKSMALIDGAKLTESQIATAREMAKKGEDVAPFIEQASKVVAEAFALAGVKEGKIAEHHIGGGDSKTDDWNPSVPGFGQAKVS